MHIQRIWVPAFAMTAALTLAACGSAASQENSTDDELTGVNFRLDWIYGAQHSGYLAADELGFYEDEGLSVHIDEGEGSSTTAQLVSSGQADIGVISAGEILVALDRGLELQAVATVVQDSPTAVIYNADLLNVETLEDLYSHTLGVMHESSQYNEWTAVANMNDIEVNEINEVNAGTANLTSFINGDMEAIIGWTFVEAADAVTNGVNAETLVFGDLGLAIPNSAIVVNPGFAAENPDAVGGFVTATALGWDYAAENQEEAIDILTERAPEADREANEGRLPIFLEHIGQEFGIFDAAAWQTLNDLYVSEELIDDDILLEGHAYVTDYLP